MCHVGLFWVPVVDGQFLPDDPNVLMESETVRHVDVLMGVVKDEGATQTGISPARGYSIVSGQILWS